MRKKAEDAEEVMDRLIERYMLPHEQPLRPCARCGAEWAPASHWNFYNLCGPCFAEFDQQKMDGRMGRRETYYEGASGWIASLSDAPDL